MMKVKPKKELAEDLKVIFREHIGENNSISRDKLFYKVYGIRMSKVNTLKVNFLWSKILSACSYCRKETKCMIISNYYKFDTDKTSGAYYFVASNSKEAEMYNEKLSKISKGFAKAGKRMVANVKKGYHRNPSRW